MSEKVYIKPLRKIGKIVLDVTIEENHSDTLEVTQQPVEQGAVISDHAYKMPAKLTITAGVSDSGVNGYPGKSREIYKALLELQGSREPLTVYTAKRIYKNMLIISLTTTTDSTTETALIISCELQQIIIATVQTVSVPHSRQKNGIITGDVQKRGRVQAQKTEAPKRQSLLKIAVG